MTRAQIVSHPAANDIEYRVTRHQKHVMMMDQNRTEKMVPEGDPYPIVEMFHRDYAAELKCIARFRMDQFIELSREVVKVGKELCPKDDQDEQSVS